MNYVILKYFQELVTTGAAAFSKKRLEQAQILTPPSASRQLWIRAVVKVM